MCQWLFLASLTRGRQLDGNIGVLYYMLTSSAIDLNILEIDAI